MAPWDYVDLPVGFKFHPTESDLLGHYLHNKAHGVPFKDEVLMPDFNLYGDTEPWAVWERFGGDNLEEGEDLYFFTTLKATGSRVSRKAGGDGGGWHGENKASLVVDRKNKNKVLGSCKRFHYKNLKSNQNGCWIMLEYCLQAYPTLPNSPSNSDDGKIVICRIRKNDRKRKFDDGIGEAKIPEKSKPKTQKKRKGNVVDSPKVVDHHEQLPTTFCPQSPPELEGGDDDDAIMVHDHNNNRMTPECEKVQVPDHHDAYAAADFDQSHQVRELATAFCPQSPPEMEGGDHDYAMVQDHSFIHDHDNSGIDQVCDANWNSTTTKAFQDSYTIENRAAAYPIGGECVQSVQVPSCCNQEEYVVELNDQVTDQPPAASYPASSYFDLDALDAAVVEGDAVQARDWAFVHGRDCNNEITPLFPQQTLLRSSEHNIDGVATAAESSIDNNFFGIDFAAEDQTDGEFGVQNAQHDDFNFDDYLQFDEVDLVQPSPSIFPD